MRTIVWRLALLALAGCGSEDGEAAAVRDAGVVDAAGPDAGGPCTDGATGARACGLNARGRRPQTCEDGAWVDDGPCDDPDVCVDERREERPCDRRGATVEARVCDGGQWRRWSGCEERCEDGAVQVDLCNDSEEPPHPVYQRECYGDRWGGWGPCYTRQVPCAADEAITCGRNGRGTAVQRCVRGLLGEAGPCDDPDECISGVLEVGPCGDEGHRERTCADGRWGAWSVCEQRGDCAGDERQTEACGPHGSGSRHRFCVVDRWGAWSECAGACVDECDANLSYCEDGGLATCGEADDDPCRDRIVTPCPGGCLVDACGVAPRVLINELVYRYDGSPGAFLELWGAPGTSLRGFELQGVNGHTGEVYLRQPLFGDIPADGYFVLRQRNSGEAVAAVADAVLRRNLRAVPASVVLRAGNLVVDAVGYGDFEGKVFAGEGRPIDAAPGGRAITRDAAHTDTDDNAADFTLAAPTPGR